MIYEITLKKKYAKIIVKKLYQSEVNTFFCDDEMMTCFLCLAVFLFYLQNFRRANKSGFKNSKYELCDSREKERASDFVFKERQIECVKLEKKKLIKLIFSTATKQKKWK